eukprot:TRINITY_DN4931_c0_g1_i1.p1 TRINITY_DN4931_c0_g1~~TRINITY_DN4931_c0_g1_i1.p1  ORF type:complete len:1115 (+),score=338.09 TRINITY_DN4931_c0_g1_i1:272-3346(+)
MIQSVVEAADTDTSRPHSLKIVTSTRTFFMCADSRSELEDWMHAIRSLSSVYLARFSPSAADKDTTPYMEVVKGVISATSQIMLTAHSLEPLFVAQQRPVAELSSALTDLGQKLIALAAAAFGAATRSKAAKSMLANTAIPQLVAASDAVREGTAHLLNIFKTIDFTDPKKRDDLVDCAFAIRDATAPISAMKEQIQRQSGVAPHVASALSSTHSASAQKSDTVKPTLRTESLRNRLSQMFVAAPTAPRQKVLDESFAYVPKDILDLAKQASSLAEKLVEKSESVSSTEHSLTCKSVAMAFLSVIRKGEQLTHATTPTHTAALIAALDRLRASTLELLNSAKAAVADVSSVPKRDHLGRVALENNAALIELLNTCQILSKTAKKDKEKSEGAAALALSTTDPYLAVRIEQYQQICASTQTLTQNAHHVAVLLQQAESGSNMDAQWLEWAKSVSTSTISISTSVDALLGAAVSSKLAAKQQQLQQQQQTDSDNPPTTPQLPSISPGLVASQLEAGSAELNLSVARDHLRATTVKLLQAFKVHNREGNSPTNPETIAPLRGSVNEILSIVHTLETQALSVANPEDEEDEEGEEEEDENIWDSRPDSEDTIIFGQVENGVATIRAATLNKLVERLTSDTSADLKYMKTFTTTYRSFTTPKQFFFKLVQRYDVPIPRLPPNITEEEFRAKTILPIQLRVCNVLKTWIETSFFDFDDGLTERVEQFLTARLNSDGHGPLAKQLGNSIKKMQAQMSSELDLENVVELAMSVELPAPSKCVEVILAADADDIAKGLTFVDFAVYSSIKPVELLNQAWSKPKLKKRSPNVLEMISRFNRVTEFAVSVIIWAEKLKERIAVVSKLVDVCISLHKLHNFNSLLAILAAFGNAAVHRLKHTKAGLSKAHQTTLDGFLALMSADRSYAKFREHLHSINPPCIPYLGVYLTDLTFIEDGNGDITVSSTGAQLINFRKRELVYNVIREIQQYQPIKYDIEKPQGALELLITLPSSDSKTLYDLSLLREKRGAELADVE